MIIWLNLRHETSSASVSFQFKTSKFSAESKSDHVESDEFIFHLLQTLPWSIDEEWKLIFFIDL